jgi:hypothetical protein
VTSNRDPFDILRVNNPVDRDGIDAHSDEANRVLATVTTTTRRTTMSRRRRLILIAAAILILATAAVAVALLGREIKTLDVICYRSADLNSDRVGLSAEGVPTASLCEQVWRNGVLRLDDGEPSPVPPLTPCVTDQGGLAVFPTDDAEVCERLGLAPPAGDQPTDELEALAAVQEEIFSYLDAGVCHPLDEATAVYRDILDRNGLTAWAVDRRPDVAGRPCAGVAYHPEDKTVIVVPDIDITARPGG